jgi:hypothetical protein
MRVFDALDAKPHSTFLPNLFTTTAEERSMDWARFIAAESHGNLSLGERYSPGALAGTGGTPFAQRMENAKLRRRVIITGLLCTLGRPRTRDNSEASRRKHFDDWPYRDTERLAD